MGQQKNGTKALNKAKNNTKALRALAVEKRKELKRAERKDGKKILSEAKGERKASAEEYSKLITDSHRELSHLLKKEKLLKQMYKGKYRTASGLHKTQEQAIGANLALSLMVHEYRTNPIGGRFSINKNGSPASSETYVFYKNRSTVKINIINRGKNTSNPREQKAINSWGNKLLSTSIASIRNRFGPRQAHVEDKFAYLPANDMLDIERRLNTLDITKKTEDTMRNLGNARKKLFDKTAKVFEVCYKHNPKDNKAILKTIKLQDKVLSAQLQAFLDELYYTKLLWLYNHMYWSHGGPETFDEFVEWYEKSNNSGGDDGANGGDEARAAATGVGATITFTPGGGPGGKTKVGVEVTIYGEVTDSLRDLGVEDRNFEYTLSLTDAVALGGKIFGGKQQTLAECYQKCEDEMAEREEEKKKTDDTPADGDDDDGTATSSAFGLHADDDGEEAPTTTTEVSAYQQCREACEAAQAAKKS